METLYIIELNKKRREDETEDPNLKNQTIKLTLEYKKGITKCLTSLESSPFPEISTQQQLSFLSIAKQNAKAAKGSSKYAHPPTHEDLDLYTQKRWDSVLHFLVGSEAEEPPPAVERFLKITGLMQDDPDHKRKNVPPPAVITSKGYEFMLQEHSKQLWQFILQYLHALGEHRECDLIRSEALLFLISLSFCRIGCAYPMSSLGSYTKTCEFFFV